MEILLFVVVGIVAGWLAGLIVKGGGFGLIGDLVIGVVGALLGGFIFRSLGLAAGAGFAGSLIVATIGAVVLLLLIRLLKR